MTDSYRLFFGILSIIPALIAYTVYFKNLFAGKIKPHAFSWLIWGILAANGFLAQVGAGAGVGSWTTGLTSAACLAIFSVSIFKGKTDLTKLDWILLSLALISFALLFGIDDKIVALCVTLFATLLGFAMTIRKAWSKPHEENATAFALNGFKFLPAILALGSYSFLTVAYPVTALLANMAVVAAVYLGRRR